MVTERHRANTVPGPEEPMPVFTLRPVQEHLSDEAWKASSHHGACRVLAENVSEARAAAAHTFGRLLDGRKTSPSPWGTDHLVSVERREATAGDDLPRGIAIPCE